MALLVDRFQNELRRKELLVDHWIPIAKEARRLAREKAKELKRMAKEQGITLPRDRDTQIGSLRGHAPTGSRINVLEHNDIQYWSQKFGVSRHRLLEVVKRVGTSAVAVEKELEKKA